MLAMNLPGGWLRQYDNSTVYNQSHHNGLNNSVLGFHMIKTVYKYIHICWAHAWTLENILTVYIYRQQY